MNDDLHARKLAEFVDRSGEMARFRRILESNEKHIMQVWGAEGIGKTSLRLRMVHECAQRKLRKAEVECGGIRTSGYLAIMRKIRDDLGLEHFSSFSDYANFLTNPGYKPQVSFNINLEGVGAVSVGAGATIDGSSVGDITGVVIKDNMLLMPRMDIAVPEEERMLRLTDYFLQGLNTSLASGPVVIFLDAVEKMAPETARWLWEDLLMATRDGRLQGVKFVLCGLTHRELDRDWRMLTEDAELQPLSQEHIEAYLEKRGIPSDQRAFLASYLLATTKGKIGPIAEGVDLYVELQERKRDEEADV